MNNIFELTETPTLENIPTLTSKVKSTSKVRNTTKILKIKLNNKPYYHFSLVEFDNEIATRNKSVVVGGKRFYEGITNKRMKTRLSLTNI